jgi:hypothetical protein
MAEREGMPSMKRVLHTVFAATMLLGTIAHAETHIKACKVDPNAKGLVLTAGGGSITVKIDAQLQSVGPMAIIAWVCNGASAVATYYGRFPVAQAEVDVRARGQGDSIGGTTWGGHPGVAGAYSVMRLGMQTSRDELQNDWTMTHEFTHMAFPQLPENQHWAEEGMATYLEPIERVQAGELQASQVWHDIYRDMQKGEPEAGDKGLNKTHTWARTYWGGAIFWFAADVEIYRHTGGKKSLRDAMRAIVDAGGNIERDGSLEAELGVGDRATGTTVLMDAYRAQADAPQNIDLSAIWKEIGVNADGSFDDHAPLAGFRRDVMQP